MSLFIKSISLYNCIIFFVILHPKSLVNLVVDVGTRHSYQMLLPPRSDQRGYTIAVNKYKLAGRLHCEYRRSTVSMSLDTGVGRFSSLFQERKAGWMVPAELFLFISVKCTCYILEMFNRYLENI